MSNPGQVRHDIGGWLSGPCATPEPTAARDIVPGDVLAYEGLVVTVTKTGATVKRSGAEMAHGVNIDWQAGNKGGRMFRRDTEMLDRLARGAR